MYYFLLALLILDAFVLIAAVLLQSGKGGGLAASFGGASSTADSLIGSRQAGNLLTKASWWCGGAFLVLAFLLQLMGARRAVPTSVLDQQFSTPASTAPRPAGQAAPAVPLTPAPAVPTTPAPTPPAPRP